MIGLDWKLGVTLLLMLIGLAGTLLPLLPGIPLIFLAMLGYDWSTGFQVLGPYFLVTMFLLTLISILAEYLSGVIGAQKYGASKLGKAGALLGGLAGLIAAGPLGLILGPLLGVMAGELLTGKNPSEAALSGWGTFLGLLAGIMARLAIASIMFIAFLIKLF
ncbi:MAG: DUF456 domain-containing protein [Syntrophomonadaceae bacterium]|nr:DUF456 domain-containing protein [Syntrophomonadaceae bacterium]